MKKQAGTVGKNATTEEKIKNAAREVFTQKGYAATRTRDIAEASGFNLALINYYFRSKEKLFDIIMMEHLQTFLHNVIGILDDHNTTLHQKLEIIISHYIDMLIEHPDLPLFILNEVRNDPEKLIAKIGVDKVDRNQVYVAKQWQELVAQKKIQPLNPVHILMNIVSMTIFPFVASPIIRNRTGISTDAFNKLMIERKKLIPLWMNAIMNTPIPQ